MLAGFLQPLGGEHVHQPVRNSCNQYLGLTNPPLAFECCTEEHSCGSGAARQPSFFEMICGPLPLRIFPGCGFGGYRSTALSAPKFPGPASSSRSLTESELPVPLCPPFSNFQRRGYEIDFNENVV
eukprot:3860947-Rhodomonas_salina.3